MLKGNHTISVSEKEVPVLCECDVAVAGGGTAGFSAAVSAARAGASVVIIEKSNLFGGLWTNGLVLRLYGTHAFSGGERKNYFGGIGKEVTDRLKSLEQGIRYFDEDAFEPTPDPEAAVHIMDQMIQEEKNITVLFDVYLSGVIREGRMVKALICESSQGSFAVAARSFVDATGDCRVLDMASDECSVVTRYSTGLNHVLAGVSELTEKEISAVYGNMESMPNPDTVWVNMGGRKCDWTDLFEMSCLEMEHRGKIWKQLEQLRKNTGSHRPYIAKTAVQMGTRVTRLPRNSHTFRYEDAVSSPETQKPVGVSGWANYESNYKNRKPGYQIPYSVILPERVENLWIAGRCVNADERIIDSLRLIPNCFITGQAAGTAAAVCAFSGDSGSGLPYEMLEKELKRQKVILSL